MVSIVSETFLHAHSVIMRQSEQAAFGIYDLAGLRLDFLHKLDYHWLCGRNKVLAGMEDRVIHLFHGSKSGLKGKIRPSSREFYDFGKGFYMGTERTQPLTLICNYPNATMYELRLDTTGLKIKDIPLGLDWAMFVAFNRGRLTKELAPDLHAKYSAYKNGVDVFRGYIANDRMFVVLDRFFDGDITDVALVKSLSALKLGIQYVAITQRACDAITVEKEEILTQEQKKLLISKSEENRQMGISLANEICRSYRREGKYFDELVSQ